MSNTRTINCGNHGNVPTYCICYHVINGAQVGEVQRPEKSADGVGSIVCNLKSGERHTADEVTIICSDCATEHGYVRGKGH